MASDLTPVNFQGLSFNPFSFSCLESPNCAEEGKYSLYHLTVIRLNRQGDGHCKNALGDTIIG